MQNLLRTFRKRTEITIEDISNLLNMRESSSLSRFERGIRKPSLEIIFTYHILFQVSLDELFEREIKTTLGKITENIEPLIENLKRLQNTRKIEERISFLESLKELINK